MSVDVDSFDGCNDVERHAVQRARKPHTCSACSEVIRPGDLYSYSVFVYEGSTSIVKRCARCELLYYEIAERLPSHEVVEESLNCGHTWEDNFSETPPPNVARLAFVTPAEAQALLHEARKESVGQ
jgi:hypothetical protein